MALTNMWRQTKQACPQPDLWYTSPVARKEEPMDRPLSQLVAMTRELGERERDFVILGEGNTSARADQNTFWVKVSGSRMAEAKEQSFVRVHLDKVLTLLDASLPEWMFRMDLAAAKFAPDAPGSPSVETALHALCLTLGDAAFVGHTHPTAINAILCARDGETAFAQPIFPAESLVGGEPLFVPFAPSGQPLAWAVEAALRSYREYHREPPRAMLLQNHGLVVLGSSPQEVVDITEMMVKTARILVETYALGGPHFVDHEPY
jgi:rhamnose utilization protein RhaD (predicted bifunctional aldolase and dehydrogenase)